MATNLNIQYYYNDATKQLYGVVEGDPITPELSYCRQLTYQEVDEIQAKRQAEYEASLPYTTKRIREYPSIGDQLDALYHAGVFPADMAAKIAEVKAKYPK